ncbi:hypothetical protein BDY21DRAFT_83702 [Lineolata rhizophorae]|uniref:Uncharacterized protein n=1 Tax=Lineolata rhizophorae TaxID=578093 RepID=A0A6A6PBZ5_9PEZI|nr:hypothetical protein BDY21DRAFT_83702 [Lineolata rhizophorae]
MSFEGQPVRGANTPAVRGTERTISRGFPPSNLILTPMGDGPWTSSKTKTRAKSPASHRGARRASRRAAVERGPSKGPAGRFRRHQVWSGATITVICNPLFWRGASHASLLPVADLAAMLGDAEWKIREESEKYQKSLATVGCQPPERQPGRSNMTSPRRWVGRGCGSWHPESPGSKPNLGPWHGLPSRNRMVLLKRPVPASTLTAPLAVTRRTP